MSLLSIIIPVFNEENTIDELLSSVYKQPLPGWQKEIIVINDGSTDGTKSKLQNWQKKTKVYSHAVNKGKGAALQLGFSQAHGDIILIQDADLEYSPTDYVTLLKPFVRSQVQVVYGSRFLGSHLSTMYLYALGNKFVTLVTNILYNTNITDMETGYKAFRRSVLNEVQITANRFDFEPDFTSKILKIGYQIYEVPISYYGRKFSEGKKLTWRDGIIAIWTLIKNRLTP